MENFKYLAAIISNEGSKPENLSRIAQTTAALSRLKIIWRDKNEPLKICMTRPRVQYCSMAAQENGSELQ